MIRVVVEDIESHKDLMFCKVTPKEAINLLRSAAIMAIDLKTTGFDPSCDEIKSITMALPNGDIYIVTTEVITQPFLKMVFDDKGVIVHSGLKDISFLTYSGCNIKSCWDTCLCERVTTRTVDGETLDYSLLACLERHHISNNISCYQKGLFWKEGFTIAGCNYLTLYVRFLFDLKSEIIKDNKKSTSVFRLCNHCLLIAAYMNTSPIMINKEEVEREAEDQLSEIRDEEADLYDIFRFVNDQPGKLRDVLPFSSIKEYIEPIYDIDNKEEIRAFVNRMQGIDAISAEDYETYEELGYGFQLMKSYETHVNWYNNVMRRYLVEADLNQMVYQHCVPAHGNTLHMKCVNNFPRTTYARINEVNPILVGSLDHFTNLLKFTFIGAESYDYSYKLFEVFNIEAFGLGILTGDANLIRLATNREVEAERFYLELVDSGVSLGNQMKSIYKFLRELVTSCFSISNAMLIDNGFKTEDNGKIVGVIRRRYSVAVEMISSMIGQLSNEGKVLIFESYPIYWPEFQKVNEIKKMFVGDFWTTYPAHLEKKDEVFDKVQFFYSQTRKADKAIRNAIVDYASAYVLNNMMDKVFYHIREAGMQEIVMIKALDESSFIVEYPNSSSDFMDQLEETTTKAIANYFGQNSVPMTITSI